MKKKICVLLAGLVVLVSLCGFAPLSAWYIDVTTTELGDVRIYLDSGTRLSLANDLPVNISANSKTGLILNSDGTRKYYVYLAPYGDQWTYRPVSGYNNTYDLHVTAIDVDSSTLPIDGATVRVDYPDLLYVALLLCLVCVPIVIGRR